MRQQLQIGKFPVFFSISRFVKINLIWKKKSLVITVFTIKLCWGIFSIGRAEKINFGYFP